MEESLESSSLFNLNMKEVKDFMQSQENTENHIMTTSDE